MFFKKKEKNNDSSNLDLKMLLPTYYEKYAKNIQKKGNYYEFQLVNEGEEEFEIYYYGNTMKNNFIVDTDDARSLVIAKDKNGIEVTLYDGFTHGYDNLVWQEYEKEELNFERKLQKLDIGFVKVFVKVEALDDDEYDWELDENSNVLTENDKVIPWAEFKRNAITWLSIDVVTTSNKKINIVDEELA